MVDCHDQLFGGRLGLLLGNGSLVRNEDRVSELTDVIYLQRSLTEKWTELQLFQARDEFDVERKQG